MTLWLLFALIGAGTFLLRFAFIFLYGRVTMPAWFEETLPFVPPAVLSALVAPALFAPEGALDVSFGNARLLAGAAAILAAVLTKSIMGTIVAGLAVLWLLQAAGAGG